MICRGLKIAECPTLFVDLPSIPGIRIDHDSHMLRARHGN